MKTMRQCLLLLLSGTVSVLGQGTVYFSNYVPQRVNAPVFDGFTHQMMTSEWRAQLLNGPSAVGPVVTFGVGVPNGYFDGGIVSIPGTSPGQEVAVAVGAFLASSGPTWDAARIKGESPYVSVRLGGIDSGGILHGLSIFSVPVPEPSSATLALLALTVVGTSGLRRKRRPSHDDTTTSGHDSLVVSSM